MSLTDDLRLAARTLSKRPLFTLVVVLTLGLSIGANTAIFTLINAALFAPLGVRAPDRLVNIYTTDSAGARHGGSSYPDYVDLRSQVPGLSGVVGYSGLMTTLTGSGTPEVIFGEIVTGNYFSVLGVPLALGRGFLPEDDATPDRNPVVVLGHGLWLRHFGADSTILGRSITLNGHPFTVVGVAPAEFKGLLFRGLVADLWAPVMMMGQLRTDQLANRGERWLFLKGRLTADGSQAQLSSALQTIGSRLAGEYPETNRGRRFVAVPTDKISVHPDSDAALVSAAALILLLVGLMLLIACTNLANLILARAIDRRREIAIRLALGATRGQLIRQLLSESALLALLGGAVGLGLAGWFARILMAFRPPLPVPISLAVGIDVRVLGFTVLLSGLACVIFGLAPALQAARASQSAALAGAPPQLRRRSRGMRVRSLLLLPQIVCSLVLLLVAGLLVRSVANAGRVDPGFDLEHTAAIALNLRLDGLTEAEAGQFYRELTRRIAGSTSVRGVTLTDRVPLDLYGNQSMAISVLAGSEVEAEPRSVQYGTADTGYFGALGIPLLQGRGFTADEVSRGAPVAMVSSETARRFWPGLSPLEQQLRLDNGEIVQIVGVAGNVKTQSLGESAEPFIYRPFDGRYARLLRFVVRGQGSTSVMVETLRREVRSIDPRVAIFESRTMAEQLETMLFPYRLAAGLGSALGLFGLGLALLGLYGVVAFSVARRTREFGIRMALGATAKDVMRLIVRESMVVVLAGIGLGLALGIAVARVLRGVLFGIGPGDPLTLLGIPLLLTAVTLAATIVPARRATQVNPGVALRGE